MPNTIDTRPLKKNSTYQKGRAFERFTQKHLKTKPPWSTRFSDVWLWEDWPERDGPDTGIDLVAREKDSGRYWAIQCKNYENSIVHKSDLDSFFTASGKKPFAQRLIVTNARGWSVHAEAAIHDQQPPCQRLNLKDIFSCYEEGLLLADPSTHVPRKPKNPRWYQSQARERVCQAFQEHGRGKLIMACGTGKTLTSLYIAEKLVGKGGMVLFVVPSISLLSQSLREWAANQKMSARYFAVCSDTKAGRDSEDLPLSDLGFPPTTNADELHRNLVTTRAEQLTVIFSTYQSLDVISQAQAKGLSRLPPFDLVIADEAHRTTGVERRGGEVSFFARIHSNKFIEARRRLYMTATPRLYTEAAKAKAREKAIEVISMDDESIYGPEFHRLDFSEAVNKGLLSDYKVIVFGISERFAARSLQESMTHEGELGLDERAKLLGCLKALGSPEGRGSQGALRRAVAFASSIEISKKVSRAFGEAAQEIQKNSPSDQPHLHCEAEHVDGKMNALKRNQLLDWLRAESQPQGDAGAEEDVPVCRILSNARCLSEGIDVPALDAILFLNPRRSQVDIVQAVGRVMRKAEGKTYGYIILPVVTPGGVAPDQALNDNRHYAVVWEVLRALRSHDNRFNSQINKLDLNEKKPDNMILMGMNDEGEADDSLQAPGSIQFEFDFGEWQNAVFAKVVEKCGDRRYWESWAKDVAQIAETLTVRVNALLEKKQHADGFGQMFTTFLENLQGNLNPAIDKDEAVDMLSQHIITRPVFDALFEQYAFSEHNPVSQAMQKVIDFLDRQGLRQETGSLEDFYKDVRERAQGIDNLAGRQQVAIELYEKFFATAFPKVSEKLGIVYTPIELVDFVLRSTDEVLEKEFGQNIGSRNVHVLDPFTGTGSFIVRLLQDQELIKDEELEYKYEYELHANEIMLLAYYIAAVNIENAYHDRMARIRNKNTKAGYQPFKGIVFTDTFQLAEEESQNKIVSLFPVNSKRVVAQQKGPIRVILGNPPWSAGQKSENDANKNLKYPHLDQRVKESYVAGTSVTQKRSLYDSYIRSIRWASDRIGREGIIAYVTNGSFLDGNAMDGLRKCLCDEFDRIYCLNLRGNLRTSGDLSLREGGHVFATGSRVPVVISLLVKNPKKARPEAEILYHDIGDYLTREAKLQKIRENSIKSLEWQRITPNKSYDWINQRNERFQEYLPMGTDEGKKLALGTLKSRKTDDKLFEKEAQARSDLQALFGVYSSGVKTNRDVWVYNFSQSEVGRNMKAMIGFYNEQLAGYQKVHDKDPQIRVDEFIDNDPRKIAWSSSLKDGLGRGKKGKYDKAKIRKVIYRPFSKQWLYFDSYFNERHYQQLRFFPRPDSQNLLICISGKGANQFSALMVDMLPDLEIVSKSQCFALYVYDDKGDRHENITDEALVLFRDHYKNEKITKEDLFYYTYAVLHWPAYRQNYSADLVKMLARIPFAGAKHFGAFVRAGRELGRLHTLYEKQKEYPLEIRGNARDVRYLEKMRFAKDPALRSEKNKQGLDKSVIIFNSQFRIEGIPSEAYEYVVNARPAIEWIMERYQFRRHKESGIVNDSNEWAGGGNYALSLLRRVVTVSLNTVAIVRELEGLE